MQEYSALQNPKVLQALKPGGHPSILGSQPHSAPKIKNASPLSLSEPLPLDLRQALAELWTIVEGFEFDVRGLGPGFWRSGFGLLLCG